MSAVLGHDEAAIRRLIWRKFTKLNGIYVQEGSMNILLSEITSLHGFDDYLDGMVAYCLKEEGTPVPLLALSNSCISCAFLRISSKNCYG